MSNHPEIPAIGQSRKIRAKGKEIFLNHRRLIFVASGKGSQDNRRPNFTIGLRLVPPFPATDMPGTARHGGRMSHMPGSLLRLWWPRRSLISHFPAGRPPSPPSVSTEHGPDAHTPPSSLDSSFRILHRFRFAPLSSPSFTLLFCCYCPTLASAINLRKLENFKPFL